MDKALTAFVSGIDSDVRRFRRGVIRVFSRKLTQPRHCAGYFFELLVATTGLYGHSLKLRELEHSIPLKRAPKSIDGIHRNSDAAREMSMRRRFRERIESLPWSTFDPSCNVFSEENLLRTQADYINSLSLHLPDIYGEAYETDRCLRQILSDGGFTGATLAQLLVSLQHAAHHASYGRHTLEILSDETNWRRPGTPKPNLD